MDFFFSVSDFRNVNNICTSIRRTSDSRLPDRGLQFRTIGYREKYQWRPTRVEKGKLPDSAQTKNHRANFSNAFERSLFRLLICKPLTSWPTSVSWGLWPLSEACRPLSTLPPTDWARGLLYTEVDIKRLSLLSLLCSKYL
jgi:hypothetical protein